MENFERHTDPAIVSPEDLAQFQNLESEAGAYQKDSKAYEETAKSFERYRETVREVDGKSSYERIMPKVVGSVTAGGLVLEQDFSGARGLSYDYEPEEKARKLADASSRIGEKKFEQARNLIDIELARKVAESEGVNIVRPEDAG